MHDDSVSENFDVLVLEAEAMKIVAALEIKVDACLSIYKCNLV